MLVGFACRAVEPPRPGNGSSRGGNSERAAKHKTRCGQTEINKIYIRARLCAPLGEWSPYVCVVKEEKGWADFSLSAPNCFLVIAPSERKIRRPWDVWKRLEFILVWWHKMCCCRFVARALAAIKLAPCKRRRKRLNNFPLSSGH